GHVLSESSITKTFVIDNDAYSRLDIFSVAVTGPGATAYTTSHNCGTSIPGHRRCALDITYNPTALGRDSAILRVETSTRNYGSPEPGVFEVPLAGISVLSLAPKLAASPEALNFGDLEPGTTTERALNVSNLGEVATGIRD